MAAVSACSEDHAKMAKPQTLWLGRLLLTGALVLVSRGHISAQSAAYARENFAGPIPGEIVRSKRGQMELVNILGSRRFRHARHVTSVAFSPDGQRALSGSEDKTLKLWEVETGKEIATWRGHESWVTSVAFSPDGQRALSGSGDDTLKLWEVETGKEIDSIVVDGGPLAISMLGNLVLVGNGNSTITVYRVK